MALTRAFQETVRERAQSEPAYRIAMLSEAAEDGTSGQRPIHFTKLHQCNLGLRGPCGRNRDRREKSASHVRRSRQPDAIESDTCAAGIGDARRGFTGGNGTALSTEVPA